MHDDLSGVQEKSIPAQCVLRVEYMTDTTEILAVSPFAVLRVQRATVNRVEHAVCVKFPI